VSEEHGTIRRRISSKERRGLEWRQRSVRWREPWLARRSRCLARTLERNRRAVELLRGPCHRTVHLVDVVVGGQFDFVGGVDFVEFAWV
jgi:hypothetical protein